MKRKIADLVTRLEECGVEISRLEWKGNDLDIEVTPYEDAVPVFIEFGYMEEQGK